MNYGILKELKMYVYKGIDERSMGCYLMDGIKIKTKALDAAKTRIMSDSTLKSDFDGSSEAQLWLLAIAIFDQL